MKDFLKAGILVALVMAAGVGIIEGFTWLANTVGGLPTLAGTIWLAATMTIYLNMRR